jgi:phosphatidylserine decarboxylase
MKNFLGNPIFSMKRRFDTELFYCTIYLAPGDYHRFHSPTGWRIEEARHFQGDLLSVNPFLLKLFKGIFLLNERIALLGNWKHGLFTMTAVGATNVGSIRINCLPFLRTNREMFYQKSDPGVYRLYKLPEEVPSLKGEEIGYFELGSTVILVFEAPSDFKFLKDSGCKVRMGESLGFTANKNKLE